MRIVRHAATAGLALAALLAAAAAAERAVEIYRPRSRTAAELVGPAQAALGDAGSAGLDAGTNALVLVGGREAVDAALQVLAELDRAPRTVVLHYESLRLADLEARGVRVAWSVSAGSFRIGNVIGPPGADVVAVRPFAARTEQSARRAGQLRILDGQSGRIETGVAVPVVQHSLWETRTSWVSAASGFEATPRVQGDGRVRVALSPFEGALGPHGSVRTSDAETEVTVAPGESVVIGGLAQGGERRTRGLAGAADEARYDDWVLVLRAEVEGAPVPAAAD